MLSIILLYIFVIFFITNVYGIDEPAYLCSDMSNCCQQQPHVLLDRMYISNLDFQQFGFCSNLISITIPDTVSQIPDSAFVQCTNLEKVTILATTIYRIGNNAFDTTGLQTIDIPILNNINDIGMHAFSNSKLKSFIVPSGMYQLMSGTFSNCRELTSVTINKDLKFINDIVFSGCTSLKSIQVPEGLLSLGYGVFFGCTSLESFTFPNNGAIIGMSGSLFNGCTSLKSIEVPEGIRSMGPNAFQSCTSLQSVTLPDSLLTSDSSVFDGCSSLQCISYNTSVIRDSMNFVLPTTTQCTKAPTNRPTTKAPKLKKPTAVPSWKPKSPTAKPTRTTHSPSRKPTSKYQTHSPSRKPTPVKKPTLLPSVSPTAPTLEPTLAPHLCTEYELPYCCGGYPHVIVDSSITAIGGLQSCGNLVSIILPSSVTFIADSAFQSCPNLKSVTIPASVTAIGYSCFQNSPQLTCLNWDLSVTRVYNTWLPSCT